MNRRKLLFIVLILFAGAIGYKYYGLNKNIAAQVSETKQAETPTDAPIATDEGVMLPDELKKGLTSVINDPGLGEDYQEEEETPSILDENVSERHVEEVTGPPPANMTKDKCQELYKYSFKNIAYYAAINRRRDKLENFTVCHALAEEDLSACGGHPTPHICENFAKSSKYFYKVLKKEETTPEMFIAAFGKNPLGDARMSDSQQHSIANDIILQKRQPPQAYPIKYAFKFLLGRSSSCSAIPDINLKGVRGAKPDEIRNECYLLADMVSAIKLGNGMNKYYLYDALANRDCSKVDEELVKNYCEGKLEKRKNAAGTKQTRNMK